MIWRLVLKPERSGKSDKKVRKSKWSSWNPLSFPGSLETRTGVLSVYSSPETPPKHIELVQSQDQV